MKLTHRLTACAYLLAIFSLGFAQETKKVKSISFVNSRAIDSDRYPEIKGDPYLMDDWTAAVMIDPQGYLYPDLQANYNGYEEELEIRNGDRYIALLERDCREVRFMSAGDTLSLKPNQTPGISSAWVMPLFEGETYTLLATFEVVMSQREIQNVGQTIEVKQFKSTRDYYLVKDGKAQLLKMRKKKLLDQLGNDRAIKSFLKEQNLKLDSEEGLVATLAFLENDMK